jgi:hypothetical protein
MLLKLLSMSVKGLNLKQEKGYHSINSTEKETRKL